MTTLTSLTRLGGMTRAPRLHTLSILTWLMVMTRPPRLNSLSSMDMHTGANSMIRLDSMIATTRLTGWTGLETMYRLTIFDRTERYHSMASM